MARKRMIDPGFWIDEKLGTIPALARLLFMGLISNADDEGRLPGHPALIKSQIFPYDTDVCLKEVEEWLHLLKQLEMIQIYSVSHQTYIQIENFLKYQSINRPTPSKYPPAQEANDDSLNDHAELNEDSRPIEEKRKEKEEKKKEKEKNILSNDIVAELPATPDTPHQEIADTYNCICKSLPAVSMLSDKRKKRLRTLYKNLKHDMQKIQAIFEKAESSDFLSGRNGKWSGCNFDWLINYNNAVKVLEGNYNNRNGPPDGQQDTGNIFFDIAREEGIM